MIDPVITGNSEMLRTAPGAWPDLTLSVRELFWRNVMREILTSLSVACLNRRADEPDATEQNTESEDPAEQDELFDGRLAILTHAGERIAIAEVYPLFACGIRTSEGDRALSMAVECSVFQIRTPGGEVFTLPLQEMRGFHSMSPDLMRRLEEEAAKRAQAQQGSDEPFGFAAFTATSREQAASQTESSNNAPPGD